MGPKMWSSWLTVLFSLRQMKRDHRAYAPGYKAYSDFRLFWGTRFFSVVTARSERSHLAVAGRRDERLVKRCEMDSSTLDA